MELLNAVDVHDRRPMDADELGVIELRFHVRHGPAHEMCLSTDVNPDVVAGRLAPVDVARADEIDAAARLDDEPIAPFVTPVDDCPTPAWR